MAQLYRIPLLMIISHRGEFGERDPWQTEGGLVTIPVLEALRIPHDRLDDPGTVREKVAKAQVLAGSALRPVGLLRSRDLMWVEPCRGSTRSRPYIRTSTAVPW